MHLCELEQGDIVGEEDEEDERLIASLVNYCGSSDQHENVLTEKSNKAMEPCLFKSNNLCAVARFNEDGHPHIVVTKINENKNLNFVTSEKEEGVFLQSIEEIYYQKLVIKEDNDEEHHTNAVLTRVDEGLMPKEIDMDFKEEVKLLHSWLVEDTNVEYDKKVAN